VFTKWKLWSHRFVAKMLESTTLNVNLKKKSGVPSSLSNGALPQNPRREERGKANGMGGENCPLTKSWMCTSNDVAS